MATAQRSYTKLDCLVLVVGIRIVVNLVSSGCKFLYKRIVANLLGKPFKDINLMLFISSYNRLWLLQILYALLTSDLTQAILYDHGVKLDK